MDGAQLWSLNERIPGRFNAPFKLYKGGIVYRLAHVSPLVSINSTTIRSIEGM